MAEDAQAESNCKRLTFQIEKEGLLRDLNQTQLARSRSIRRLLISKDLVQKETHLFKRVKYEHGYMRLILLEGIKLNPDPWSPNCKKMQ